MSVIMVAVSAVAGFLGDIAVMFRYTIKNARYFISDYDYCHPRNVQKIMHLIIL